MSEIQRSVRGHSYAPNPKRETKAREGVGLGAPHHAAVSTLVRATEVSYRGNAKGWSGDRRCMAWIKGDGKEHQFREALAGHKLRE